MTLSQQQGQLSAFVATWTEDATASGAIATATHVAEAGKSHYITGFSASSYDASAASGTSTIQIKDDTDVILTIYQDNGASASTTTTSGKGAGVTHSFTTPVLITAGNPCSIEITNSSATDLVAANLWGFTSL